MTLMVAISPNKGQNLRSLNTRSLLIYRGMSVEPLAVAKSRLAAISIIAKPNVDCMCNSHMLSLSLFIEIDS